MLEGGEDPRFIARRMVILASEDVGNADPQALPIAVAAAHAVEHVGMPECSARARPGGDLPVARAEVERRDRGDRRRARATSASTARSAARLRCAPPRYPGAKSARPRPGLRLPARRGPRACRRRSCCRTRSPAPASTSRGRARRRWPSDSPSSGGCEGARRSRWTSSRSRSRCPTRRSPTCASGSRRTRWPDPAPAAAVGAGHGPRLDARPRRLLGGRLRLARAGAAS